MLGALLLAATAACAAYALSKLSFPGRRLIFSLVLIGFVVPVYGYFVQPSSDRHDIAPLQHEDRQLLPDGSGSLIARFRF